jgi:hypothetical protein
VFEVELERIFNFSMTCGQNIEMKIDIGRLYSGLYDPKLATQSDRGNVVKYGNSGPMYSCTE